MSIVRDKQKQNGYWYNYHDVHIVNLTITDSEVIACYTNQCFESVLNKLITF